MKSVKQVLEDINKHKPCSRAQLYRYLSAANIKPVGGLKRPQLYPDDTAQRVLAHLGLTQSTEPSRLVTLPQLKTERSKARRAK